MDERARPMHYVATLNEARDLIKQRDRFWVSNCGCRQAAGSCGQSRMDVCLYFTADFPPTGKGKHEIGRGGVEEILKEAWEKRLVARPFRDEQTLTQTVGICFCCRDCCGYFLNPQELCDKGAFIEATDMEACTQCMECVAACPFLAREMREGKLAVDRDRCFGCGLCVSSCSAQCIKMVPRI